MNGILLIDKPVDLTSAEVVRRVKRRLPRGVKVGHLGTLDPFATGLLPLCLGEATKIAQFLNCADKRYRGVIQLGWATDTGDRTGRRTDSTAVPQLDAGILESTAARFRGEQQQRPPMYSALKQGGVPLYRLARQGVEVERALRTIQIHRFDLSLDNAPNRLCFDVACSKGTYVRVLAEDVGVALGTTAHLDALQRSEFGSFAHTESVPLDAWDPANARGLLSIREALAHLPCVRLDAAAADAARQGKALVLDRLPGGLGPAALLLDPDEEVAAVVVREAGPWRYGRVLGPAQALHGRNPMVAPTVE